MENVILLIFLKIFLLQNKVTILPNFEWINDLIYEAIIILSYPMVALDSYWLLRENFNHFF